MNLDTVKSNLEKKGYTVFIFDTEQDAVSYLKSTISGTDVGFGGSQTLTDLDLRHVLAENNKVIVPDFPEEGESFRSTADKCLDTEVFLLSANAVTEAGEIVNIDGTGNRLAGSLYGHKRVIYVIGENKIGGTLEEAIRRARNIAAPKNALGLYRRTPCAMAVVEELSRRFREQYQKDPEEDQLAWQDFLRDLSEEELNTHCYDCKSPGRICASLLVLWQKPSSAKAEVIILKGKAGF